MWVLGRQQENDSYDYKGPKYTLPECSIFFWSFLHHSASPTQSASGICLLATGSLQTYIQNNPRSKWLPVISAERF